MTARTSVTCLGNTEISELVYRKIPSPVHIEKVKILGISSGHTIAHALDGMVGDDLHLKPDRTGKPLGCARDPLHLFIGGEGGEVRLQQIFKLYLIQFVVAPDEDGNGGAVHSIDKGFEKVFRCYLEETAHLLNGPFPRCLSPGELPLRNRANIRGLFSYLRLLFIGCIAAGVTGEDTVLS